MPPPTPPSTPSPASPRASADAGPGVTDASTVISAEGIGVQYRVATEITSRRAALAARFGGGRVPFWALRDVSFTVGHGEMFFIIGRNGAGKTTLLKVLAETLIPDAGVLRFRGEVTAFLSMGLGFQPDLSAIENMELALTLMGVPASDFAHLRREIEAFTQLGPFMAMPVSSFSAGMKARLGFAIATCVEPDILIMDEVINAGDEQFRDAAKKRLAEMLGKARAIIVATHNMQQVLDTGHRAMWIESGKICAIGDPKTVVDQYHAFVRKVQNDPLYDHKTRQQRFDAED